MKEPFKIKKSSTRKMIGKRYQKNILRLGLVLIFITCTWQCTYPPPTGWPVEPMDKEHEIGASAGEFRGDKIHDGIDILVDPYNYPDSPPLKAVRDGRLFFWRDTEGRYNYHALYLEVGNIRYIYAHVDEESVQKKFYEEFTTSEEIVIEDVIAGQPIGHVVSWPDCHNHHLHFEIKDISDKKNHIYYNPLLFLPPCKDEIEPIVDKIRFFKQDDPTYEFNVESMELSGSVDIVVEMYNNISSNYRTSIYSFSCTVEALEGNHTMTFSYQFDTIPKGKVEEVYRVSDCTYDKCGIPRYNYIVTNVVNGKIDSAGAWHTAALENGSSKFPDGDYIVTVTATDLSGNSCSLKIDVEVGNDFE